ncbi:hypothetical protein ACLOJK_032250 [Asimina triloba]
MPFADIQLATENFHENSLLGSGGFDDVCKGVLKDGKKVAAKWGKPGSGLRICIDAAQGLHYLHTGSAQPIIHRDVKSANILLDEMMFAKVADFGLSKVIESCDQSHVSTVFKGRFGYLDPEYYKLQHLMEKSDVYSFGVVLLEVLCAWPAVDPMLPKDKVSLAEWAMGRMKAELLDQIVDPRLIGHIDANSLRKFRETMELCLAEHGADRPTMGDNDRSRRLEMSKISLSEDLYAFGSMVNQQGFSNWP